MAVVQRSRPSAGRTYPPLVLAVLMMVGLLAVMPSALNIPQSTPSETLEYAPVPPEDQDQPPPATGNFSSLGLGSSAGPGEAAAEAGGGDDLGAGGDFGGRAVKKPSTKRCVGNPPRQTEDPLAPPCVGFFEGDNGGATYQGVTRDEVRVIIIAGSGYSSTGNYKGNETTPVRKYYDLAEPAKEDDHSTTRYLRAWQQYFNERYQTYGRFVHFWAFYPGPATVEDRRSDAVDNYNKIKPFATVWPLGVSPNIAAYTQVMASKGVVNFTSSFGLRAADYSRIPKMNWGFLPSLEEHSKSFSAFVCEKVAGKPVEFSGNVGENGRPRKYGLIYTTSAALPYGKEFVDLVTPQLRRCGVTFAETRTHPYHGAAYDGRTSGDYAAEAMATFQQAGITTILWLFGYEANFSRSAAALNYRPEWILAGDGLSEGNWNGQDQEQSVWDHAITFTLMTKTGALGISEPCRDAYLQADPEIPRGTLDLTIACFFYDELRMMFTGIQVAGSRLNPDTMDKGFHAIPPIRSTNPSVPACFYHPGDFTCVKDGTVLWYDSQHQDEASANTPGCWRLLDGGQRYFPGTWPEGNVMAQRKDSDPCNGNLGGRNVAA